MTLLLIHYACDYCDGLKKFPTASFNLGWIIVLDRSPLPKKLPIFRLWDELSRIFGEFYNKSPETAATLHCVKSEEDFFWKQSDVGGHLVEVASKEVYVYTRADYEFAILNPKAYVINPSVER